MKIIKVVKCVYCPYKKGEYSTLVERWVYWCFHANLKRAIHDINSIPDWCPLEDDPLPAMQELQSKAEKWDRVLYFANGGRNCNECHYGNEEEDCCLDGSCPFCNVEDALTGEVKDESTE